MLDLTKLKLCNNNKIHSFHQKVNYDAALLVFVAVPSSVTQILTQKNSGHRRRNSHPLFFILAFRPDNFLH